MQLSQHDKHLIQAFHDACDRNKRKNGEESASASEVHTLLIERGQASPLDTVIDIADIIQRLADTGYLYDKPGKKK